MSDEELGSVDETSNVEPAEDYTEADEVVSENEEAEATEDDETETIDSDEGDASDEGSAELEFVSVEYDGQTYEVPPELKDAFMRTQDYTGKTTELAEQRKQFEQSVAQAQRMHQANDATIQARVKVAQLQEQLSAYDNVDWQTAIAQQPQEAMQAQMQRTQLQEALNIANQELEGATNAFNQEQEQSFQNQVQETLKAVANEIPDWGPEKASALRDFAVQNGVPAELVDRIATPYEIKLLDLAMDGQRFREMQAKAKTKPKETPKPVKKISAKKQAANKNPDKMSTEEWMAWRNKQVANR